VPCLCILCQLGKSRPAYVYYASSTKVDIFFAPETTNFMWVRRKFRNSGKQQNSENHSSQSKFVYSRLVQVWYLASATIHPNSTPRHQVVPACVCFTFVSAFFIWTNISVKVTRFHRRTRPNSVKLLCHAHTQVSAWLYGTKESAARVSWGPWTHLSFFAQISLWAQLERNALGCAQTPVTCFKRSLHRSLSDYCDQ
jgi:hypothetical protein